MLAIERGPPMGGRPCGSPGLSNLETPDRPAANLRPSADSWRGGPPGRGGQSNNPSRRQKTPAKGGPHRPTTGARFLPGHRAGQCGVCFRQGPSAKPSRMDCRAPSGHTLCPPSVGVRPQPVPLASFSNCARSLRTVSNRHRLAMGHPTSLVRKVQFVPLKFLDSGLLLKKNGISPAQK